MATTNYPGSLDAYPVPNNGDTISVADHWLGPAVIGIETELGTDPAGYATDVKTRLSDINPSEGNLNLDAGYGSKAPIYGVRAWVNFDGTTNVAGNCTIRGSANVSSVADTGTGSYTVNFTSAMPDVNYASVIGTSKSAGAWTASNSVVSSVGEVKTVSTMSIETFNFNSSYNDSPHMHVTILR